MIVYIDDITEDRKKEEECMDIKNNQEYQIDCDFKESQF